LGLAQRKRDLAVATAYVQNRGDIVVEQSKKLVFLNCEHPLPGGISKARGIFVRGRVDVCILHGGRGLWLGV
jgi:hypothetical protein